MDCLIISYSEPSRNRERSQFFNEQSKVDGGWERFLHLNYVNYDNDIMLPNHLASIAKLADSNGGVKKNDNGYFDKSDISTYSAWKIPLLGGIYLYQYLKSLSLDVGIIQHAQLEQEELDASLRQGPKVIAISTTLTLNPFDITALVKYCRSISPESFIVLGGMSVWNSYLSSKDNPNLFKSYKADAVVLDSKGFKTLGSIVQHIKDGKTLDDVPNLLLYKGKSVKVTQKIEESFDFNNDSINWDLVDDQLVDRISLVRTQISCPFTCSFCSYPVTQGALLKADMDTFESELKALQKRGVKYILFVDDTFNVPKKRFRDALTILKKYKFRWYAFIRCQYLDEQVVSDMEKSGCGGVYLGIESSNKDILKAMHKEATPDDYRRGVALMKKYNILTYASFIVGFPGETENTIQDTKNFIETSGIDFYNVKTFYYEHSTPISRSAEELGLTGQGMRWTHNTMNSTEAFEHAEKLIMDIENVPYIPQHSGEIWEIAYFHGQGFSNQDLHTLYNNFSKMLKDDLSDAPNRIENQKRLFQEIVDCVSKVTTSV
jgi:radical SAM PhpK family P-methyltransferase